MPPGKLVATESSIIPTPTLSVQNIAIFSAITPADNKTHHLGHQYVFGGLPLTSLTVNLPLNSFVAELALQAAEQLGYRVWRGNLPANHPVNHPANQSAKQLLPEMNSLSVEEADFSITAYDALLFRIIHLTNNIKLNLSSPCRKEFFLHPENDQWFYKKRAHLPLLSYLGTTMIRDELRKSIKALECRNPRIMPASPQPTSVPTVIITTTLKSDIDDSQLLDALDNSWGFTEQGPAEGRARSTELTKAARNALQTGLENSAFRLPLPILSLRSPATSLMLNRDAIKQMSLLFVRLNISGLSITDNFLSSEISLNISRANASGDEMTLYSSHRTVQTPAETDSEGGIYESLINTGLSAGNEIAEYLDKQHVRH